MKLDSLKKAKKLLKEAYKLQMNGSVKKAIELYKESIQIYPTAEAYTFLGWAYSFEKDYQKAIELCKIAIDVDPDFGNPYNDIGAYLVELNKFDEAIPWLKKAMAAKRYENHHFPHLNYARILEKQGKWLEALEEYKATLRIEPNYELAEKAYWNLVAKVN